MPTIGRRSRLRRYFAAGRGLYARPARLQDVNSPAIAFTMTCFRVIALISSASRRPTRASGGSSRQGGHL
jgi:hypothetical protein